MPDNLPFSSYSVNCDANHLANGQPIPAPLPLWTENERKAISTLWKAEGRYKVEPTGEERINITIAGSLWHWNFANVVGQQTPEVAAAWRAYLEKRRAFEKGKLSGTTADDPGPLPDALKTACGELPTLYEKVRPNRYTITFPTEETVYTYTDTIPFGDRANYFAYYRSTEGVMKAGKRVKNYADEEKAKADALFASVGKTESERKILQAVSALEGGFEAINTYDTGWVSIGFIQFITAIDGTGSLSAVLERYKNDDPADFAATFHNFGIDVVTVPKPTIAVVDPETGQELVGAEAVRAIIRDKRLTAIFERAGYGDGFRRAQIRVARDRYWPGDDIISVSMNEMPYLLKVADVVKSEAGMATLMDRKVNRGSIRGISEAAQKIVDERKLTDPLQLANYEKSLIAAMKYRAAFLEDPTLTQPPAE